VTFKIDPNLVSVPVDRAGGNALQMLDGVTEAIRSTHNVDAVSASQLLSTVPPRQR
jgi:hypothetical protein